MQTLKFSRLLLKTFYCFTEFYRESFKIKASRSILLLTHRLSLPPFRSRKKGKAKKKTEFRVLL